MDRIAIRRIVNLFIAVTAFGSWSYMFFFGTGSLIQNGIGSMRYFTVLSNLFAGAMAVAWLVGSRRGKKASGTVERLKYIAAAAVGLTCLTVLGFLGLIYGYMEMLSGPNLFMHLLTPVAAIAEIIFLSDFQYTRRDNLLVMVPPLLYGIGYIVNIAINGMGEWPQSNDWYFFFAWGYAVGMVIYAVLLGVTWLTGLLMRKLQRNPADID